MNQPFPLLPDLTPEAESILRAAYNADGGDYDNTIKHFRHEAIGVDFMVDHMRNCMLHYRGELAAALRQTADVLQLEVVKDLQLRDIADNLYPSSRDFKAEKDIGRMSNEEARMVEIIGEALLGTRS